MEIDGAPRWRSKLEFDDITAHKRALADTRGRPTFRSRCLAIRLRLNSRLVALVKPGPVPRHSRTPFNSKVIYLMNENAEQWERFLDPDVVRPSLFLAAMFITTFEVLKASIVDDIRNFYTIGFGENGPTLEREYQSDVLSKNKSVLYASLQWLRENEAIDDEDLATFEKLKSTRNLLAHQLFGVVTGQVSSEHEAQFDALVALLRKIGVWWVVNVEIRTDPEFDGREIDEDGIVTGAVLSLQMLIDVASGNTELLEYWRKSRAKA